MRQLLDNVFNSLDASVNQSPSFIQAHNLFNVSAQCVVTGSSTGTLKLQFSNDITDPTLQLTAPTNWSDIPNAAVTVSGAGVFGIAKADLCYQFIRLVFIKNNGSAGTISANIKALGA
jgi:hypothetical protein